MVGDPRVTQRWGAKKGSGVGSVRARPEARGPEQGGREPGSQEAADRAPEPTAAASSTERPGAGPARGLAGAGRRSGSRERRLARPAAHHSPPLPGQPRKSAGAGRGGGDSGGSSPGPQRAGREGGRVSGVRPPTSPPLWAQLPTPTTPPSAGARHPQILSPPLAPTPREIQPAATTAAAARLGRGPVPQAPRPIEVWAGRGWEAAGGGGREGRGWGEAGREGRPGPGLPGRGAGAEERERRGQGTGSECRRRGEEGRQLRIGTGVWTGARASQRGLPSVPSPACCRRGPT